MRAGDVGYTCPAHNTACDMSPVMHCAPQDIAQLVVVVNQGILQQASRDLTIAQASTIADNTLEYTIRACLWALNAPEILVATQGKAAAAARLLRLRCGCGCTAATAVAAAAAALVQMPLCVSEGLPRCPSGHLWQRSSHALMWHQALSSVRCAMAADSLPYPGLWTPWWWRVLLRARLFLGHTWPANWPHSCVQQAVAQASPLLQGTKRAAPPRPQATSCGTGATCGSTAAC